MLRSSVVLCGISLAFSCWCLIVKEVHIGFWGHVQGWAENWSLGLVNLVPPLAYLFCLALPAAFTRPVWGPNAYTKGFNYIAICFRCHL